MYKVVGLGRENVTSTAIVHAPVTLQPTPFPRASFQKAKQAAGLFNLLIDRVAQDDEYLQKTLALAAEYDEFTVRSSPVLRSVVSCVASPLHPSAECSAGKSEQHKARHF